MREGRGRGERRDLGQSRRRPRPRLVAPLLPSSDHFLVRLPDCECALRLAPTAAPTASTRPPRPTTAAAHPPSEPACARLSKTSPARTTREPRPAPAPLAAPCRPSSAQSLGRERRRSGEGMGSAREATNWAARTSQGKARAVQPRTARRAARSSAARVQEFGAGLTGQQARALGRSGAAS